MEDQNENHFSMKTKEVPTTRETTERLNKPRKFDNSIPLKNLTINDTKEKNNDNGRRRILRSISDEYLRPESATEFNHTITTDTRMDSISMISGFDSRSDSLIIGGNDLLKPFKRRDTNNISLVPADFSISENPFKVNIETGNGSRSTSRRSSRLSRKGSIRSSNTFTFETLAEYPNAGSDSLNENIEVWKIYTYIYSCKSIPLDKSIPMFTN